MEYDKDGIALDDDLYFEDDASEFVHWEYERQRIENGISPKQFIDQSAQKLDSKTQLELIEFDIEFRLSCGESFRPDSYFEDFPHLIPEIIRAFIDVKREHQKFFCPLRHELGALPATMGNYQVIRELGRGGMGVVYLARSIEKPSLLVAIKILFVDREKILDEAEALRKIDHPNVCQVVETGKHQSLYYMALDYIPGWSLKTKLAAEGVFSQTRAATLVRDIANGISAAHDADIVHFDLKLSNILIDENDTPFTTDFGLAIEMDDQHDWSNTSLFGSLMSMPPEFFNPELGSPGKTSDVYGIGVILYQLVTGKPPFRGRKKEIREQICDAPPPRPSDFEGIEVDADLERIVMDCLTKRCSQRIASARELACRLDDWLGNQAMQVWRPHLKFGVDITQRLIR